MVDPLESAVNEVLAGLGFELVELRRVGSPQRPLLQIRMDLPGAVAGIKVTTDDCVRASRALEAALEGRGLVGPEYTLEVSSPGSDRPLRHAADWARFVGRRAKVRHASFSGSRYGTIEAREAHQAREDEVVLRLEDTDQVLTLDLAGMREARLAPRFEAPAKPGKPGKKK